MQVKQLSKLQGQQRLVVLFSPGEEVVHSLAELAKTRSILGAHFTGIGALRAVMLGFFVLPALIRGARAASRREALVTPPR